jgi:acid phosphatase class B
LNEHYHKFIVVDIDGTIAKMSPERQKFIDEKRNDWDYFYSLCFDDEPIKDMIDIVNRLSETCFVVFCTGRREEVKNITRKWIHKNFPLLHSFSLIMRNNGDERCDSIVKPIMLEQNGFNPENVLCIFEDRKRVVKKWRELGYRCLQVCDGNY